MPIKVFFSYGQSGFFAHGPTPMWHWNGALTLWRKFAPCLPSRPIIMEHTGKALAKPALCHHGIMEYSGSTECERSSAGKLAQFIAHLLRAVHALGTEILNGILWGR